MTHATRRGNATFGVLLVLIGVAIAILNAVAFHPGAGTQWTKRTEHVHTLEDGSEVRWTEHEAVSVKEGREMAALEQDAAPLFSRTAGLWGADGKREEELLLVVVTFVVCVHLFDILDARHV